jgi:S-adenosylmethionine/arginine decarboxylase-like enzyme
MLVHKHLIIRAECLNPIKDEKLSCDWLNQMIKYVGMKPMIGPFAKYLDVPGNRGLTVAAIIETSHCVVHIWDEDNPAMLQFDLYSCGPFNPGAVCKKIERDFNCTKIEYKFIDRETNLTLLERTPRDTQTSNCVVNDDSCWV